MQVLKGSKNREDILGFNNERDKPSIKQQICLWWSIWKKKRAPSDFISSFLIVVNTIFIHKAQIKLFYIELSS